MLKTLTPACAGTVVVLLWLSGGGPAGPWVEIELAAAGQDQEFVPITDEMLRDPDPADWLMGTYDFQAFSPLDLTRENVASSGSPGCARWTRGTRRSGRWSTTA